MKKASLIRLTGDFSLESMESQKMKYWHAERKIPSTKFLYTEKLSLRNEEVKTFASKQNLREITSLRPALKKKWTCSMKNTNESPLWSEKILDS